MVDAVVLAGGEDRGEIAAETGIVHRSLLEVSGVLIIQRVLAALRGATAVDRVVLVAPGAVQAAVVDGAVDERVDDGGSFASNVLSGVDAASHDVDSVLIITADIPLVTPAAINDLIQQSEAVRADLTYPVIPRESCERAFPGGNRTYVKLRDGVYTGGNAVVAARDFVALRRELIQRLYGARKNPVKLAAIFGLGFIFGLLTGRLSLPQLQARGGQILGARVAAVISTFPELGFDVDKLADLNLARQAADAFDRA
jgi:molybdopterin-guanine dinucleotide biosynthesis protein A